MKSAFTAFYHGALFVLVCIGLLLFYAAGVRSLRDDADEINGEDAL